METMQKQNISKTYFLLNIYISGTTEQLSYWLQRPLPRLLVTKRNGSTRTGRGHFKSKQNGIESKGVKMLQSRSRSRFHSNDPNSLYEVMANWRLLKGDLMADKRRKDGEEAVWAETIAHRLYRYFAVNMPLSGRLFIAPWPLKPSQFMAKKWRKDSVTPDNACGSVGRAAGACPCACAILKERGRIQLGGPRANAVSFLST